MRALFPQSARNVLIEREDLWGNLSIGVFFFALTRSGRTQVSNEP